MKLRYAVIAALFVSRAWADTNQWSIQGWHAASQDKAAFDVSQTGVITTPGGVSYVSASSGKIKFELDRSETAVEVETPRWGAIQLSASLGSLNYEVSLPSGTYVNRFKEGGGFMTGVSLGWEALRQTLVTPVVEMRVGWKMSQVKLRQFINGQTGASEYLDNRMRTDKFFVGCQVKKDYQKWTPQTGVEVFKLNAELKNLQTNVVSSGDKWGYVFSAGVARRIYKSGFLTLKGFLGDEMGYLLSLKQEF